VICLLRLVLALPYSLINYGAPVLDVPLPTFTAASTLGIIPGLMFEVYLGSLARDVQSVVEGEGEHKSPKVRPHLLHILPTNSTPPLLRFVVCSRTTFNIYSTFGRCRTYQVVIVTLVLSAFFMGLALWLVIRHTKRVLDRKISGVQLPAVAGAGGAGGSGTGVAGAGEGSQSGGGGGGKEEVVVAAATGVSLSYVGPSPRSPSRDREGSAVVVVSPVETEDSDHVVHPRRKGAGSEGKGV
jgi:hypothetical protein